MWNAWKIKSLSNIFEGQDFQWNFFKESPPSPKSGLIVHGTSCCVKYGLAMSALCAVWTLWALWAGTGLYLIEHVNFVQLPHFQHALHFNHQHNQIVTLDILKIYMNDLHDVHAWSSGMGRQLYWICFKMDGIQHLLYCVVLKFNCSRFDSVLNIYHQCRSRTRVIVMM